MKIFTLIILNELIKKITKYFHFSADLNIGFIITNKDSKINGPSFYEILVIPGLNHRNKENSSSKEQIH